MSTMASSGMPARVGEAWMAPQKAVASVQQALHVMQGLAAQRKPAAVYEEMPRNVCERSAAGAAMAAALSVGHAADGVDVVMDDVSGRNAGSCSGFPWSARV